MMTLEDLQRIKAETEQKMNLINQKNHFRIVVGMATCGITAGAKEVYDTLVHEVNICDLTNVDIVEVGCIGECALEPIIEIYNAQGTRTTYCKVKPDDVERIINRHIMKGFVVEDLLLVKNKKAGGLE
ncbi:MAG: (2Fe-2S) ferredoxin domain-containing protein [Acholeplasmataceae bacterium]|jgi:NADP-reducing hydrogenase subunit HndB|nr:(2Fe-2S) ferredoxin domain-containing protein [Acholeplasmataceae bacterium]